MLSITSSLKFESKIILHVCDTYDYDYLPYTLLRFYLIDFQLSTDSPSKFCVFHRKIT